MHSEHNKNAAVKPYEPPKLSKHGKVSAITAGQATGARTDGTFIDNDPVKGIGFSP